jgi:hypothetical protein
VLTGRWWLYPVGWLAAVDDVWRVMNRLRAVAEHGGMEASKDRRRTTHHMHQSVGGPVLDRAVPTPVGTWPTTSTWACRGATCPRSTSELVDAGWVTDAYVHPSYRAFWRACTRHGLTRPARLGEPAGPDWRRARRVKKRAHVLVALSVAVAALLARGG